MGLYLPGADIHDFLACLGKHAVEKASFGFLDLKTVEPECHKILFVEDTDEFTQCADGFGLANKEEKEVAPGGWGESIQKEDNPGWDAEPSSEVKNGAMQSDPGWATAETCPPEGGGWADEQVAVNDVGWDSMEKTEVDKADHVSHEGGWGSKQEAASNNGWDSSVKSDVNTTAPAAQTDNWDSMEGHNPTNGTSKAGFMHPSRRSMNAADSTENPGASERRNGNFAPSGIHTVPLGRRKRFVKADVNSGLTDDKQCEEKDHMGWGARAPSVAGDDFGWGGSNREEEKTHANATQQGSGQDTWASEMDWETSRSEPASQSLKNDSLDKDTWQTVSESETLGMNGWGSDSDWKCKGNSEAYETAPSHPPDSWGAMEGQNARKGGKGSMDVTDRTEKVSGDERRSGRFAPSGSNTVPLGKRRSAMKPNVSNNEPESMMMKNTQPSGGKADQTGWANCEQTATGEDFGWDNSNQEDKDQTGWVNCERTTTGEDFGWDNINQEDKEKCEKSSEEPAIDKWRSDEEWGKVPTGQTNQGMENDSIGKCDWNAQSKGEASADVKGWGSGVQIAENSQDDGWGDVKSDSPSVACSNSRPKPSPSSWDSACFKSSDTQPSRGFAAHDGTPRPWKKFNRGSSGDSWAGPASKSPQSQSRRPRLRSLLTSPEYSELDELYKATNKILHHNEYQLGDKLNADDEKFILEKIIVHHQDKEVKVGCGVDYVMIDSHPEHQVNCFWVVRKDGTKTDFSYWKCLEGLYETKYSQGATKDGVKDQTNDGGNWGTNSKAPFKCDQEGAKGSWHIGGSSMKDICDKEKMKGSWNMGVSSANLSKGMFDKEEAKDSWDMGASSAAPMKNVCDQGDGWDTWASSTAPTKSKCDQGEAKDSWDTGANCAANTCDQATRKDVPQDDANDGWKCDQGEAKDSWDMGANCAANTCDQATRKDVPQDDANDGWGGF